MNTTTNTTSAPKWSVFLTYLALAIVTCVIVLGSWTRLADAGLGCPDWPGCYGSLLVPESVQEIAAAPAPETTIVTSSIFLSESSKAFKRAAADIMAVPC